MMKNSFVRRLIIVMLFVFSSQLLAEPISKDFSYEDYDKSVEGTSRLTFKIWSTKLGLFTSEVVGGVRKFNVGAHFDEKREIVQQAVISFNVVDMDTDISARNNKMHDYCLNKDKSPKIEVTLVKVPLSFGEYKDADAEMFIRGKKKNIKLQLTVSKNKEGSILVKGHSDVSFSSLEIPDPSIVVATVKDKISIDFEFIL